ncbi:FmdB family zinc ribbon protein [Patescibacteria group bacterium]
MPKYSLKCKDCENKFELTASIKEKEEGGSKFNCPKCKSQNTKHVFSFKSFFTKDKDGGCCCSGDCK